MKITITKGLPGSGKSTWAFEQVAARPNTIRVNKDDLRAMLYGTAKRKGWHEKVVLGIRDSIIAQAIADNKDVIVDDTNLNPIHEKTIRALVGVVAPESNVEVSVRGFNTSLEECIERDLRRPDSVGETVIREMHETFIRPTMVVKQNPDLPRAIICDLDGTLALIGDRNPYSPQSHEIGYDKINPEVEAIIRSKQEKDYALIISSGRSGKYLQETHDWLKKHGIQPDLFLMRKEGDGRKDSVLKREMFMNEILPKYYVDLVLDDRQQVVDTWRDLGLTVFQVADGNF